MGQLLSKLLETGNMYACDSCGLSELQRCRHFWISYWRSCCLGTQRHMISSTWKLTGTCYCGAELINSTVTVDFITIFYPSTMSLVFTWDTCDVTTNIEGGSGEDDTSMCGEEKQSILVQAHQMMWNVFFSMACDAFGQNFTAREFIYGFRKVCMQFSY